jgi:hypothetical protein
MCLDNKMSFLSNTIFGNNQNVNLIIQNASNGGLEAIFGLGRNPKCDFKFSGQATEIPPRRH